MSGLNQIKQKAKLSLDEMYDNESVGKPATQNSGNTSIHKSENKENNPSITSKITEDDEIKSKPEIEALSSKEQSIIVSEKQKLRHLQKYQNPNQMTNQKSNTYKMTFVLSEKTFKEFNDLYAKRMLKGCKTDKSDLINEAIEWLVKMEE